MRRWVWIILLVWGCLVRQLSGGYDPETGQALWADYTYDQFGNLVPGERVEAPGTPHPSDVPITFAGGSPQNLADYFGITPEQANMLIRLQGSNYAPTPQEIQQLGQWASTPVSNDPFGATNRLEDISLGLQHLGQHPVGSQYAGDFNVEQILPMLALDVALAVLAPGALPYVAGGQAAGAGAGAGIAAGTGGDPYHGALQGAGYGGAAGGLYYGYGGPAEDASAASKGAYIPENASLTTDLAGNPSYMLKTPEGISYVPAGSATPGAFYTGPASGALGPNINPTTPATPGGVGSSFLASHLFGGLFGGAPSPTGGPTGGPTGFTGGTIPLSLPQGQVGGGPTPQQIAAGANQSEMHRGLAPWFKPHTTGQPIMGGIAYQNPYQY